jgi:aspartate 1-decarboxylase
MQEYRIMCKSKIHNAVVKAKVLDYEGSITIDEVLVEKAGLLKGEKVEVLNLNTGARFQTYVMIGERNSGMICVNGPAARLVEVGDKVVIINYCILPIEIASTHKYKVIYVDKDNKFINEKLI